MKFNEWCTNCKEYDKDKHCCPRFNKVIRNTLNDSINAVLDKIRTEIEQLPTTKCTETCRIYIDADEYKKNVIAILDKNKAESEDEQT